MTATIVSTTPDSAAPVEPVPRSRTRGELVALTVLLAGTALAYLWNLGASGWANDYYAAAVQSMTQSWEAFFFGSLDAGNIVTVDKPPAALWVMAASARIFGFSSWSMLVPQALMGVGAVALLYAAVRRVSGPGAAWVAGAVLALTPVAVLMFRFNNPDALLVLLMVAAAYATVRAIEGASTRWLLLAGTLIGFAFLAKMAQAFIVVPALALAYLVAAPTGFWRRIRQLLGAGAAVVVAAGWWVAIAELWPAASRPYVGGSTTNSVLELALGYNGLGRIFGNGRTGGPGPSGGPSGGGPRELVMIGGGPGGGGFGGDPGITRLFNSEIGGQIAWLLPAALVLLVAGLWITRRAVRSDAVRASLILWGTWTVVTALVFSFAEGIFHGYYTVALAPGIAALVGIGGRELWRHRTSWAGRSTIAVTIAGTAALAWVLLERTPTFAPWVHWTVAALAAVTIVMVLLPRPGRRVATVALLAAVLTGIAAPAAYAVQTSVTAYGGSVPLAGPTVASGPGGDHHGGDQPSGNLPGGNLGGGGGPGRESIDAALVAMLRDAGTTWSAATVGANSGGSLALASGTSVMSIGGFSGRDPAPTLEQFQAYVAAGDVWYFVDGGRGDPAALLETLSPSDPNYEAVAQAVEQGRQGGPGGGGSAITDWVKAHFASTKVGAHTIYDLSQPLT
ncbi:ArnT family glycosyltransferase [Pseudonocardia sp. TRM90224]|uniref:ArnT family glycosyltransferase n=1 Tax=Pseudonocardia sp. TRM90224 TaxID=2812678 RepID=UPI001E575114|nr:glycosyltransferase family 39 protein [Pseudonocardia sp. TRM90224]